MDEHVAGRREMGAHEQIASDLRRVGAYLVAHADEFTGGGSELIGVDSLRVEVVLGWSVSLPVRLTLLQNPVQVA